jgi:hypothetical protein
MDLSVTVFSGRIRTIYPYEGAEMGAYFDRGTTLCRGLFFTCHVRPIMSDFDRPGNYISRQ